jgi:hypothetical protein
MTGAIAMGTNNITGLGTPTASTDAANKDYIDTMATSAGASATAAGAGTSTANDAARPAGATATLKAEAQAVEEAESAEKA